MMLAASDWAWETTAIVAVFAGKWSVGVFFFWQPYLLYPSPLCFYIYCLPSFLIYPRSSCAEELGQCHAEQRPHGASSEFSTELYTIDNLQPNNSSMQVRRNMDVLMWPLVTCVSISRSVQLLSTGKAPVSCVFNFKKRKEKSRYSGRTRKDTHSGKFWGTESEWLLRTTLSTKKFSKLMNNDSRARLGAFGLGMPASRFFLVITKNWLFWLFLVSFLGNFLGLKTWNKHFCQHADRHCHNGDKWRRFHNRWPLRMVYGAIQAYHAEIDLAPCEIKWLELMIVNEIHAGCVL